MGFKRRLLFWTLLFVVFAKCVSSTTEENRSLMTSQPIYTFLNDTEITDIKKYCADKPCIEKCCGENKVFDDDFNCINVTEIYENVTLDLHELKIYKNNIQTQEVLLNKTVMDLFHIVVKPKKMAINAFEQFFVTEDGKLTAHRPNRFRRWVNYDFCVEYYVKYYDKSNLSMEVFYTFENLDAPEILPSPTRVIYSAVGEIISCIFMFVVLVVYALLPELRNLHGLVSIATVFTMFCAFINFSVDNLKDEMTMNYCIASSVIKYFLYLSTFFWLAVHSYTAFSIFTKNIAVHNLPRNVKRRKFAKYCAFAWGVPLLMTAFVEIMDYTDLSDYPWIIKPLLATEEEGCFFSSNSDIDHEKALYLYTPIMILIFANMLLCAITVCKIWEKTKYINKTINERRGSVANVDRSYFYVYIKLTTVTGISWIFEAVINYLPNTVEWFKFIVDTYNMLFGVIIFFMFIWKKRIWRMLNKKFTDGDLKSAYLSKKDGTGTRDGSKRCRFDMTLSPSNDQVFTEICLVPTSYNGDKIDELRELDEVYNHHQRQKDQRFRAMPVQQCS